MQVIENSVVPEEERWKHEVKPGTPADHVFAIALEHQDFTDLQELGRVLYTERDSIAGLPKEARDDWENMWSKQLRVDDLYIKCAPRLNSGDSQKDAQSTAKQIEQADEFARRYGLMGGVFRAAVGDQNWEVASQILELMDDEFVVNKMIIGPLQESWGNGSFMRTDDESQTKSFIAVMDRVDHYVVSEFSGKASSNERTHDDMVDYSHVLKGYLLAHETAALQIDTDLKDDKRTVVALLRKAGISNNFVNNQIESGAFSINGREPLTRLRMLRILSDITILKTPSWLSKPESKGYETANYEYEISLAMLGIMHSMSEQPSQQERDDILSQDRNILDIQEVIDLAPFMSMLLGDNSQNEHELLWKGQKTPQTLAEHMFVKLKNTSMWGRLIDNYFLPKMAKDY